MQFLNKYEELDSVDPESWEEAFFISASCVGVRSGFDCNFIINFYPFFMVFSGVGGVGREFVISQ